MADVLSDRLELRMTPQQREAWSSAAEADRRHLAQWIRLVLDRESDKIAGKSAGSSKSTRRRKKASGRP